MSHEESHRATFLVVIASRLLKDALLSMITDVGIHLVSASYCLGTVKASYLMNTLGLVPEENKVLITCVSTKSKTDTVLKLLVKEFSFNEPNTGIAFTIPVDHITY